MTDPLDVETEALIDKAIYSGCSCMVPGVCRYCTSTRAALRSRIRELIEETRKEDAVVTVYCDGLSLRLARGQCYSAAVFGLGDTQVFLESETGRGDDTLIEDQFEAREGMRFYRAGRFIND